VGIRERKAREKERRRQQIIVAAKRVFSKKGFNKATMEDIAAEAELSPGTLYLYFKNKEELYASLSLRILQYLRIRVEHVHKEAGPDPQEKLEALIEALPACVAEGAAPKYEPVLYGDYLMERIDKNYHYRKKQAAQESAAS